MLSRNVGTNASGLCYYGLLQHGRALFIFEIIGATIVGYMLFGDFPDAIRWLGIFIIVSSGIYLFMRGRKNE